MASNHEGYSLDVNVNFSELEKANKATGALYEALGKVNQKFSGMHVPDGIPREINNINSATASYIKRLESEGRIHQANTERVKAYQAAVSSLTSKQKSLENQLSKIAEKSGVASSAYQKQQVRINETATAVNNLNSKIQNLRPTGFNRLVSATKRVDDATEKMKSKLHSAWDNIKGGATVAAGAIGAVGAATISGAKKAGDLQQTYKEITNLATLGGEKAKEVTKSVMAMQSQGRDMSIKYGKSQSAIAEGYEDLVKRGYTTKQAIGAMETELQASVASGDKFADVTKVSSQVIDSFGLRAKNTTQMLKNTKMAVNELAYSADATSTGFSTIGIGMSYVGAAAKALNVSLAETASAMGVLSNNGLESDKAGTGLRSVINGIGNQVNLIGTKKSVFDKIGIKRSDVVDARGKIKPLSHDLSVIYKQIKAHSQDTVQSNGFFKSIFGTTGQQAAIILAKNTKELKELTKNTQEAGSKGNYVAQLAAKNGQTAKMQVAKAKQAVSAFQIEMGAKFLPVINKAGNKLAKFLTTKDGKQFEKNVAGAIGEVSDALINLMDWSTKHTGTLKAIGGAILAGYSVSKGIKFINFLGEAKSALEKLSSVKGLFGQDTGFGSLNGVMQSAHSVGGFKNLSTAGKAGTVAAGAGVAIDAGASFYSAYQNRHSADKRSQDIGKGIGAGIGGGIGLWFGGPLGAAVGAQVGKVIGGWGGKAVNSFTKGWQKNKPPKKFWSLENLGWSAHDMAKKTGRAAGQAVNSVKKGWTSHKPPKKFWSLENLGFAGKVAWNHTVYGAAINSISAMRKGWTADKPPKKFWSLENLGWSAHSMFNGFISAVKGTIKWFQEQWDGMTSWIGKTTDSVKNAASDIGGKIGSIFSGSKSGKKVSAHATGGRINSGSMALVGEAGAELAYKVNGKHARLLGANGPEITKVHSNEHILNAHDTHRVLNGGLGNGVVLKGYATGNSKINSTWKKTTDQTGKETKKTRVAAVNEYTAMRHGVNKQMTGLHDGTVKLAKSTSKGFGKALGKMKSFASDAMKDTIDQINRGITGIDKVLSQFGGNASVIKPVKFAAGSNGQLANNTLAMVNDAQSGPRQEAIVKSSGDIWLPHGDNRILPLQKGDAVLNGSQTQQLANSWGLPHFAKGSGVSPSVLKKIASRGAANPAKSFADMFTSKLKSGKVDITAGTVDLAKNSGRQLGVPWTNAMWTVINNAIGDGAGRGGTREAFLKYAEANFSGVKYVMGAASKAASDCSGMIMQALRHFNVNIGRSTVDMQNSGGTEYLGKSLSKTVPGDLVIFGHGTGAAGHVGIIKNPKTGTMFNETPPSARVSRISDDTSMGYGFYRVKGLHDASAKSSNAKPSTRLMNLAKRQLGAGAIKWIKDKLGDEGSLGSNIGGEGVQRWAGTVKRVLGMLGLSTSKSMIDKVLRQIQTESGGNPAARQPGADPDGDGSGPALGLMQTKRQTYETYKRKGAAGIFNGPDNLYAGVNYAKHRYGPSLSGLGNGHGYAKGGNPPVGDSVLVGENGPEIAKFKDPVHVYSHEQSKRLKLDDLINKNRVKMPKVKGGAPNVTININGNISSEKDAKKYGDIIYRKISEIFEQIGLDYGADPSMY